VEMARVFVKQDDDYERQYQIQFLNIFQNVTLYLFREICTSIQENEARILSSLRYAICGLLTVR